MTTKELIDLLSAYPADTPVLDRRLNDLQPSSITEQKCDDWSADDGSEDFVPGVQVGLCIGPRF